MRELDWSKNPIGPIEGWPQSLRTVVGVMLDSRFAMRVVWGPQFIFLYNDSYRPILGATKHPKAMGSRTFESFAEVWPIVGPLFKRVYAGESVSLEDTLLPLSRNGYLEECFFTLSYSPIRVEDGTIGGLLGVINETTDRVLATRRLSMLRELAGATGATSAEQACLTAARAFGHNSADVPFSLLYLTDESRSGARLVASAGAERGSKSCPERLSLHDDAAQVWPVTEAKESRKNVTLNDVGARLGPIITGPYPEPITQALVVPLVRPGIDEPYGFLVAGLCPRRQLDDRYLELFELASGHIVTGISNALSHQAQQRQVQAMAELDRAKTLFFNNVSHEFRTPLTLMLGPLDEAVRSTAQALTGKSLLTAHRNAHRLLKLVSSLLDFSRIEAGRLPASYEPLDLGTVTRELTSAFVPLFQSVGLRLEVEAPSLPPTAYVDREMWEKIVLNLVSNAFKFTFEGGVKLSVRLDGHHVELQVRDTGTGIAPGDVPRLFERFHRVEGARARSSEGAGIGLALVSELVKLLGGAVAVQSVLGEGSTFTVRIPLGTAHLQADRIAASSSQGKGASPLRVEQWVEVGERAPVAVPNAGARVLVADDNPDMLEFVSDLLAPFFTVEVAADGHIALDAALANVPDLVLTDVTMPTLDGFGLLKALRADPRTMGVPVILLSARAGEDSRVEGLEAGADDYLVKPFSPRELIARVRTHVELRRLRASLDGERRLATEAERARLYAVFMQAPIAICVLRGPAHVFELANAPYLALVGNRPVIGKPLAQALPEVAHQIVPLLDEVRRSGIAYFGNEVPITLDRDGARHEGVFNFVYQPVVDDSGAVDGIAVVSFEVTETVRAKQRAERLTQALQVTNRELDQFAYVASHDLKAPLRAIANLSQWVEEGLAEKMDEETRTQMTLLRGRVVRLESLIDGILNYARAGRTRERAERVDVAALIAEVRDLLSPKFPARIVIGEAMPVLVTERVPLQQVLMNLISNALKHARRDDVTVTVSCVDEGEMVRFTVSDDGPGIDPRFHDRIWAVFTTLEARDKLEGTGIGLSIVKKLVEGRGGKVSITSQLGQGAAFHLTWPKRPLDLL